MRKSILAFIFVCAHATALTPHSAHSATVPALTLTGGTADASILAEVAQFGWAFTVSEVVQVEGIGIYDHNQDGLSSQHRVRFWIGPLLDAGATFLSGSSGTLVDQFRYLPFTTFPLIPGTTYFVTATYLAGDGDNFLSLATGLATDPRISYLGAAFALGFDAPALFGSQDRFFGPNLLLTTEVVPVPIPAALPLFGSALAAMGIFRCWRRRTPVAA